MRHTLARANKFGLMLLCLGSLGLGACHSDHSTPKAAAAGPPLPLTPQQQIASNFKVVKDNGSYLHNPALMDASGTMWSAVTVDNVTTATAEEACNEQGGTLPTSDQQDQLAKYLGRDSKIGFHPEYAQIPNPGTNTASAWVLADKKLWSTIPLGNPVVVPGMDGNTGDIDQIPVQDPVSGNATVSSALCVFPKEHPYLSCALRNLTTPSCQVVFASNGPASVRQGLANTKIMTSLRLTPADAGGNSSLTFGIVDTSTEKSAMQTMAIPNHAAISYAVKFTDSDDVTYQLECAASGANATIAPNNFCQ